MKVGILTCQSIPNLNSNDQDLIPKLATHSIVATAVIWNDPQVDWTSFDALLFRNTWDYYEKQHDFDLWLTKIEQLGIKTLNSISVINQNKHKFYLRALEGAGIRILPTVFIDQTAKLDLKNIIPNHWKKAVIKPAYSGGSFQTTLFDLSQIDEVNKEYSEIAAQKDLLLQEFMPEIQTLGETSFIFFNKKFAYAVNKQAVVGDFRIQQQFGGTYCLVYPSTEIIRQAQAVVNKFDEDLLYARVDAIVIDNELHLMEIECLEPDLYFQLSENGMDFFVAELVFALQNSSTAQIVN